MSSNKYNQLLKFLYFEGYADSYAEAEELLESMSDEEFEDLLEAKDIPQEVALKLADMLKGSPQLSKRGGMARGLRQYAIERNKKRLEKLQQNEEFEDILEAEKMKGEDPCWKGYQMVGTKKKGGKEVPNCVPKEEYEIEEEKKDFPTAKVERQIDKHTSKSTSSWSNRGGKSDPRKTDSYGTRSRKMSAVKSSVERGEDPRKDSVQGDQRKIFTKQFGQNVSAKTVDNEKSAYTPGGLRAHQTKAGGYRKLTRKEELEMQEAWYNGSSGYRTTASGRRVMRDEPDEEEQYRQSDMIEKNPKVKAEREAAARKAAQARMKAKGTTPKKGGKDMFEEVVEYLFVEGYADTIEGAEEMAENISEGWVNEIMEAAKDQSDKQIEKGVKTTYKAGNVLDNLHQGRSKGINKLPATEKDAKVKRMRGRLKSRRDDLFKERGNREDAKRAELKKLLGL